jgi:hypothetical protein
VALKEGVRVLGRETRGAITHWDFVPRTIFGELLQRVCGPPGSRGKGHLGDRCAFAPSIRPWALGPYPELGEGGEEAESRLRGPWRPLLGLDRAGGLGAPTPSAAVDRPRPAGAQPQPSTHRSPPRCPSWRSPRCPWPGRGLHGVRAAKGAGRSPPLAPQSDATPRLQPSERGVSPTPEPGGKVCGAWGQGSTNSPAAGGGGGGGGDGGERRADTPPSPARPPCAPPAAALRGLGLWPRPLEIFAGGRARAGSDVCETPGRAGGDAVRAEAAGQVLREGDRAGARRTVPEVMVGGDWKPLAWKNVGSLGPRALALLAVLVQPSRRLLTPRLPSTHAPRLGRNPAGVVKPLSPRSPGPCGQHQLREVSGV